MKVERLDRWYFTLVACVIFFSVILRTDKIDRPLLDAHYFRQTQTATIARNFYLGGIDLLHTKLDIFGEGKKQEILLEFPIYQAIVTLFSYILGFHDLVGRLVSLIFTTLSGLFLVLLINQLTGDKKVGVVALVFFLFNPLNYYFGQAYIIEPMVIFFYIFSLYCWFKFSRTKYFLWQLIAFLSTAVCFVTKNVYAPFLLVLIAGILYFTLGKKEFFKLSWLPLILFDILLVLIWQHYVDISNLANGHSNFTLSDPGQRLWNFGTLSERFNIGGWLLRLKFMQNSVTKFQWPMFFIGVILLISQKNKFAYFLLFWLGTMIVYYLTLFRIQSHDYYFMIITPIFGIISAYGLVELARLLGQKFFWLKSGGLIFYLTVFIYLALFTYKSVQNAALYFAPDFSVANKISIYRKYITKQGNILFVYPEYDWNSVYTYYTNRKGIVIAGKDLSDEIISDYTKIGYRYAIIDGEETVKAVLARNPDIKSTYKHLYSENDLLILDLSTGRI